MRKRKMLVAKVEGDSPCYPPQDQDFKFWTFHKGLGISRNHLRTTILYMSIVTPQTASAFPRVWD